MLSESEASPNERGMCVSMCEAKGSTAVKNNPFEGAPCRNRVVFTQSVPYEFGDPSAAAPAPHAVPQDKKSRKCEYKIFRLMTLSPVNH
jgi:hypothetical protein